MSGIIKNIIKELRINHYIKNLILFIPLIFSLNITNKELVWNSFIAFCAFCAIASLVYIFNDIVDINADKNHPTKSQRPIACGKLSISAASVLIVFLGVIGIFLSYKINLSCLFIIILYVILNIAYSLILKNHALIDAFCIALGFILRILAGSFAIGVEPSALVILLTFFLSLFFTFSKRKLELRILSNEVLRKSSKNLDIESVDMLVYSNAILSIAFYFTYVMEERTIAKIGSEYIYITVIPFVLIIYRLLVLINSNNEVDDPIKFFERDKTLLIFIIGYFVVFYFIYY